MIDFKEEYGKKKKKQSARPRRVVKRLRPYLCHSHERREEVREGEERGDTAKIEINWLEQRGRVSSIM